MLGTRVNMQVVENLFTKTGLGEHSFDGPPHEFSGSLRENLLGSRETLATRITGVASVNTAFHLVTLEGHLLGVNDDDVVTFLPRRTRATLEARRPSGRSVASMTTHSLFTVALLSDTVL